MAKKSMPLPDALWEIFPRHLPMWDSLARRCRSISLRRENSSWRTVQRAPRHSNRIKGKQHELGKLDIVGVRRHLGALVVADREPGPGLHADEYPLSVRD